MDASRALYALMSPEMTGPPRKPNIAAHIGSHLRLDQRAQARCHGDAREDHHDDAPRLRIAAEPRLRPRHETRIADNSSNVVQVRDDDAERESGILDRHGGRSTADGPNALQHGSD